jgi:hypothetical protein
MPEAAARFASRSARLKSDLNMKRGGPQTFYSYVTLEAIREKILRGNNSDTLKRG